VFERADAYRYIDRGVGHRRQRMSVVYFEKESAGFSRRPGMKRRGDHLRRKIDPDSPSKSPVQGEQVVAVAASHIEYDVLVMDPSIPFQQRHPVLEQPVRRAMAFSIEYRKRIEESPDVFDVL
jgi:hypothetical protein